MELIYFQVQLVSGKIINLNTGVTIPSLPPSLPP